ncbi:MAG: glutamate 5-kinase [Herpetosiphon sp.]
MPPSPLPAPARIVVKVGTSVLTAGTDRLHRPRMVELIRQLAELQSRGHTPILVSSGAVLAGWETLGFPPRRRNLPEKQFFAAVGQGRLMHIYAQLGDLYGLPVAQTLLTRDDLRDRRRYLNARNTFLRCMEHGVLPIVNENDVVAIDEIRVGDNDNLSALVANLVDANLLVICTDIAGLYTADPRVDPAASLISEVSVVDATIRSLAGGAGSHRGTGGMATKLQAAALATESGTPVVIASGALPDVVLRVVDGEAIGTLFPAKTTRLESRKRWILAETVHHSNLTIDVGAANALRQSGKSLLPPGIINVVGEFDRGQTVRIFDADGHEIARGLTQYSASALALLHGAQSKEIEARLGYTYGSEVVHRDDMVLL